MEHRTALRLLGPDLGALPAVRRPESLRAPQRRALEALSAGRDVLVHGAPRSGRTALALAAAADAGEGALLLSPRRSSAARLRDALGVTGSRARAITPAALGFALVRQDAVSRGLGEPALVTGADQDSLIAELIAARDAAGEPWHLEVDAAARVLPGFRTELRDLITRAAELGLGPQELERLGLRRGRPAWRDAAALLRDYLGVLDLEAATALDAGPRLDSGAIVRRGAALLESGAVEAPAAVIVVDDAQDLTTAGVALVLALAHSGARVLATACPDEAVDTFRGAVPDAAARLRAGLQSPEEVVLPAAPSPVLQALRARLPLAGAPAEVRRPGAPADAAADDPAGPAADDPAGPGAEEATGPAGDRAAGAPSVVVLRADDALEEARLIGAALRDLHHREGIGYDEMAVICRSGGAVEQVADLLARTGLPVRVPRRLRPLREESVVDDLLAVIEIGLGEARLDPLRALELLRGPFGDADALRLRRIRRRLLAAQPLDAPSPSSEELLARALVEEQVPGLPAPDERDRASAPVHRLRGMIAAVRAQPAGAGVQEVLWAAWDAAGLAGGWRRAALGAPGDVDGARARLAAARLDALMALFAAAERLADRRPGAGPLDLVEQVRAQAVVEDTLAAGAEPRGRLAVLTPAQIAGEDRDTVVLARVQEGLWPDLRLRSTLFGAAELSLLASSAEGEDLPRDPEALRAVQRRQVVDDELRLAVSAISRARRNVLVTAVDDAELVPSALVDAIETAIARESAADGADGPAVEPWLDIEHLRADPGPAPDVRRLVSALRRRLRGEGREQAGAADGAALADRAARADGAALADGAARDAALALTALAGAGAPGADPARWYHQRPSSDVPLQEADSEIALSPSALERADDCPRAWLMERAGGTRSSGPAQVIGTALHRIAQENPRGAEDPEVVEDLLAQLHALLRGVPGLATWSGRRRVARAEDAARLLAQHLARAAGEPLAIEEPFVVSLGRVRLRGTIDRIEGDAGGVRVVDLKTGRSAKTAKAAETDLQLAAYQAAVREGALDGALGEDARDRLGGAELVYVGTGGKKASVRTQGALDHAENPRWFDELVERVAGEVSGRQVVARINAHCSRCGVRSSCPLQSEGAQL
ncbi:PD-(D/E)XK nuclease family protein [Brachybacterium sp. DNPG3]